MINDILRESLKALHDDKLTWISPALTTFCDLCPFSKSWEDLHLQQKAVVSRSDNESCEPLPFLCYCYLCVCVCVCVGGGDCYQTSLACALNLKW